LALAFGPIDWTAGLPDESDTGEVCKRVPGMYTDVMSEMRTELEGCG
jgi:hypothetical protein